MSAKERIPFGRRRVRQMGVVPRGAAEVLSGKGCHHAMSSDAAAPTGAARVAPRQTTSTSIYRYLAPTLWRK